MCVRACVCVYQGEREEDRRRVPAVTAPSRVSRSQQSSLSGQQDAPLLLILLFLCASADQCAGLRSIRLQGQEMRSRDAARNTGET